VSASYSKLIMAVLALMAVGGCSTGPQDSVQPIANPFKGYDREVEGQSNAIRFKTTHGDSSYEVAVPNSGDSDLEVPFTENGSKKGRSLASGGGGSDASGIDYQYRDTKQTMADREIASTFNRGSNTETDNKRSEIEGELGLEASEGETINESYLAKIDVIKQLFRTARFEAALIELDRLVQAYPNNSRLYEMRGTVLDRLGYSDLAIKSWRQALEFNPSRLGLKKLVEKREQQRAIASERGKK